jgi:hypothetical protein
MPSVRALRSSSIAIFYRLELAFVVPRVKVAPADNDDDDDATTAAKTRDDDHDDDDCDCYPPHDQGGWRWGGI